MSMLYMTSACYVIHEDHCDVIHEDQYVIHEEDQYVIHEDQYLTVMLYMRSSTMPC